MSTAIDKVRAKLLQSAFRMPSVQTMVSRKSSMTNAFVNAIIPVVPPTVEEIEEALRILEMDPSDVRCAYGGDRSTEWDHLRPLVKGRRPTGFISEIGELGAVVREVQPIEEARGVGAVDAERVGAVVAAEPGGRRSGNADRAVEGVRAVEGGEAGGFRGDRGERRLGSLLEAPRGHGPDVGGMPGGGGRTGGTDRGRAACGGADGRGD